jgi:hypothetical protein
MSIIGPGSRPALGGPARWIGYGLAIVGLPAPIIPASRGGTALALAVLILPLAVLALLLYAPEAFSAPVRGSRTGRRMISPILAFPSMGLLIAALSAHLTDATPALAPAAICAVVVVLLGLGAAARPMPGGVVSAIAFLAVFGGAYGYGAMVYADMRFDGDAAQRFRTEVRDRYETHGRGAHYHVSLAPFGPLAQPASVSVPYATYSALITGDLACVSLHPGALNMAWYEAAACGPD